MMKKTVQAIVGLFILCFSNSLYARSAHQQTQPAMLPPTNLNIKVDDRFTLSAQYFAAAKANGTTIILHDCSGVMTSYVDLAQQLQRQRHNALLVSLRGYGRSTTEIYSHQKIKQRSPNIIAYQEGLSLLTSFWQEDVLAVYQYLRKKLDKKLPINMVTSGCSAFNVISTAEKMRINKAVFITPELDFSGKERYKNLMDIPTYFIDSVHHIDSYQVTRELFEWNGESQSRLQLFKGNQFDAGLLRKHPALRQDIALWLAEN